ncbi:KAP family P-loop domain-containing protein [Algibacter lectus]|uniref:P-loop NTPase fold protein n=1 Tax=Algibacter lectus TaxID=221126 RepID=UPI0008E84830|nr:P-loop NTPase fold protein [Algibacter lectus]SFB97478.1 KAP family P-loop domain-containing protein [Algibacter lectus]
MSKKYNFIDNKPLGKDLFEGKSQERTSNVITNIIKDNTFQVIGIDGGWGVGKSNLVKIVEDKLNDHIFFIYDVWGHQEDEQRRSLLIELTNYLTKKDNNFIKKGKWEKKLTTLLSKKKEVTTENLPYLSVGFIFALIAIIYAPTVTAFKGELSDWLGIKSVFWRLVLVLFPIFIVAGIYVWNLFKNWKDCNGFWTSFKLSAQETFQIYTNKQKKETKIESISEEEPSVRDFQEWMTEIDNDLNKNLVLVLDNFDRLPKKHILNVWSSIHVFFAEKKYNKIKVIIPFDRKHIKNAFSDLNGNSKTNYADDYINKTFDIVFRVAPPIMSSWKEFFKNNWKTAFTTFDENEFERVEQAYEILNVAITPREIVAFINNFISIKLIDDKIPDRYIAIYLLRQEQILDNTLTAITELNYLDGLEPIYKNDEDFQKHITALAYQIDSDNAIEVIYKNRLRDSLINNEVDVFKEIQEIPAFKHIIKPVVSELEDYRKPIIVLDSLSEKDKISASQKGLIWNIIHSNLQSNDLNLGTVENYQLILLRNLTSKKQKGWLTSILKSLWLDNEEFEIIDYVDNIDKVVQYCVENNLELKPFDSLVAKTISPEKLKLVIDNKQGDYGKYKLNCEIKKIDNYLIKVDPANLKETSFIEYLKNPLKLVEFHKKLLSFIALNKRNPITLFQILEKLKLTTNTKLDVEPTILDADIYTMLSSATIEDNIYIDLAALRLSLLTSSNAAYNTVYQKVLNSEDEEFYGNVANQLEWYINYSDFLVGSISFTNSLTVGVVKKLIQLKPTHRDYTIEPILENIISICHKNKIDAEELLNTLQIENELDKTRVLNLEPSVLSILKESSSNIALLILEIFNNNYRDKSKDEWEESFKDLNSKLFQQLKTIRFIGWNRFSLEVFDSVLLKIADDSKTDNKEIVEWLLKSFEKSERDLDNTLKSLRDRLIQNNNITNEIFILFAEALLAHASLKENASDVVRTIFKTELLDSDECVYIMTNNSENIKTILNNSGKSKDDFRDGLKARISKEDIQQLSKELGFKIKPETKDSDNEKTES